MDVVYLLVPISLLLIGLIVWALIWAVKSGQFEDLEGPAHRILMEEDEISGILDERAVDGHRRSSPGPGEG